MPQTADDPNERPFATADPRHIHLRLLATSDLHVHILPHDYYSGRSTDTLGFARTASLISLARAETANCLLFDNGDFLQGSPLGDYVAQSRGLGGGFIHPMIAAMNLLGYDAGTLGNHEFSHGLDFLTTALEGAEFPIVASNVLRKPGLTPLQDETLVAPYVLLDRHLVDGHGHKLPVRIGVIGFTPPQILIWDRHHLKGRLFSRDILQAAQSHVAQMRRDGADLIIALSHSGIGSAEVEDAMENASTALARIPGIDAVITGHSHLVFPSPDFDTTEHIDATRGTICGKPAVMPGFFGSHLGVIDLLLIREEGRFVVKDHRSEARPIAQRDAGNASVSKVPSHPGVVALTQSIHDETLQWIERPIGHTKVPLNSYFALVCDTAAMRLVARAQACRVRDLLADTPHARLAVLGSAAPFKAGGRGGPDNYTDVPAGGLLYRHAADLYIHPNTLSAIRLTGAEILAWLEFAVGIYNRVPPGSRDLPLINPDFPSFNFEMIYGLSFGIDLGQLPRFDVRGQVINPQSQRIVAPRYNGAPLDPSTSFVVATNSYRISANGGILPGAEDRVLLQTTETNREVLLRHFTEAGSPTEQPNWHFVPMPGTSVTFDTSPKAAAHLAAVSSARIEPMHQTPVGFMRYRLHL